MGVGGEARGPEGTAHCCCSGRVAAGDVLLRGTAAAGDVLWYGIAGGVVVRRGTPAAEEELKGVLFTG